MNTVAYVQRALNKYKPVTLVVSIEEREKAKATIFKLLQQDQFREEMISLKASWKANSQKAAKSYISHPFWMKKHLFEPQAE